MFLALLELSGYPLNIHSHRHDANGDFVLRVAHVWRHAKSVGPGRWAEAKMPKIAESTTPRKGRSIASFGKLGALNRGMDRREKATGIEYDLTPRQAPSRLRHLLALVPLRVTDCAPRARSALPKHHQRSIAPLSGR